MVMGSSMKSLEFYSKKAWEGFYPQFQGDRVAGGLSVAPLPCRAGWNKRLWAPRLTQILAGNYPGNEGGEGHTVGLIL